MHLLVRMRLTWCKSSLDYGSTKELGSIVQKKARIVPILCQVPRLYMSIRYCCPHRLVRTKVCG